MMVTKRRTARQVCVGLGWDLSDLSLLVGKQDAQALWTRRASSWLAKKVLRDLGQLADTRSKDELLDLGEQLHGVASSLGPLAAIGVIRSLKHL